MSGDVTILKLRENDYGVYISRYRGPYGTFLAFRGTAEEVEQWQKDHKVSRRLSGTRVFPKDLEDLEIDDNF